MIDKATLEKLYHEDGLTQREIGVKLGKPERSIFDLMKKLGVKARPACGRSRTPGEMSGQYWRTVINGAKSRNMCLNVTAQQAWDKFLEQGRRCALTGLELGFVNNFNSNCKKQTASLDRIDSTIGYELTNVQWVHKKVNLMKQAMSDAELIYWCEQVYKHSRSQK